MFNLKRVIYSVHDVDEVTSFYERAFGFERKLDADFSPKQWSEMEAGDCNLGFFRGGLPKNETLQAAVKVVYFTPDLEAARDRLLMLGAVVGQVEDRGQFQICNCLDPWGFSFQLSNRESA